MSRSVATVVLASALVLLAMGGTASAGYDHLLAPTTECGRSQQTSPKLSADKQEAVMRCMHNYARKKVGKGPLAAQSKLTTSAGNKAVDVQKCRDADYNRNPHDCGPGNTWYHIGRAGYCYSAAGENVARGWGSPEDYAPTVRDTMSGWLNSETHRENILGQTSISSRFTQIGIGLVKGPVQGHTHGRTWAVHFARPKGC